LLTALAFVMPSASAQDGPEGVVESFYGWYLDYAGYDEASESMQNPLVDGAYAERPELAGSLVEKVAKILKSFEHGAYDPLLCAQDLPERFEVELAESGEDAATVLLHEYFSFNPWPHTITVHVSNEGGEWLIRDVLCGETASPRGVAEDFYRWYLAYSRETGNPLVDKAYRDYAYLTEDLIARADAALEKRELGSGDPFLCAQDRPMSFEVSEVVTADETASVLVREFFGGSTREMALALVKVGEQWMIDAITCEAGPDVVAELLYNTFVTYKRYDLENGIERVTLADWGGHPWMAYIAEGLLFDLTEVYRRGETLPADPFLCAQDLPEWVGAEIVEGGEGGAVVRVSGSYPAGPESYERYDLAELEMARAEDGTWQIAAISCAE
jgi:hypothetical protein